MKVSLGVWKVKREETVDRMMSAAGQGPSVAIIISGDPRSASENRALVFVDLFGEDKT